MPDRTPFDIRKLIAGAESDDEIIQATYDAINRLVLLVGDVPFHELFRLPLRSLARTALANLKTAKRGVIRDPAGLGRVCQRLVRVAGGATVADLFCGVRGTVTKPVVTALVELRRSGIRIPIPVLDDQKAAERRQAVGDLLRLAPNLTYRQLFTRPKDDIGPAAVAAVSRLKALGLFSWGKNDRCCKHKGGADGIADLCVPHVDLWCNLTGQDGDLCSIASDACPAEPRPSGDDATASKPTHSASLSKFEVALPDGGRVVIGVHSSPGHTIVYHHAELEDRTKGDVTVTCTCWSNGVAKTTTKTCPEGGSPLCDCSDPSNPKITC